MRLLLVRHGETDSNAQGLALGRADVPLNERGRWQAQRLGVALADEPLARIYASPLQRALHTAEAIAAHHDTGVTIEDGLIEMEIGEADGLAFGELGRRFPGLLERWMSAEGPEHPMPGGERLVDVRDRAWETLQRLMGLHPEETICAVTHNFVILTLLTRVMGIELADFRQLRHGVAAVTTLDVRPDGARVLSLNDTGHLGEEPASPQTGTPS